MPPARWVAAGAADCTSNAYDSYLQRAEVSDVVLNPALATTEIDRVIPHLPGVRAVTSEALFLVTTDDGHPRPVAELDDEPDDDSSLVQVRGVVPRPVHGDGPTGDARGPHADGT